MLESQINGIFVLKREFGNNISLLNTNTKALEYMDYFKFKPLLEKAFGLEKSRKILELINCYNKVILDFDKAIAKLIKDKPCDFNKVISSYLNTENIENEYNNYFDLDSIEGKFQNL